MQTPYQPPQSRVADAHLEGSGSRPRAATIALILFGLYIGARFRKLRFPIERFNTGEMSGLQLLLYIAVIGFLIFVAIRLAKRAGWARWVVAAMAAWEVYDLRIGLREMLSDMYGIPIGPVDIVEWLVPAAFSFAAAVLVFGPASGWFLQKASSAHPYAAPVAGDAGSPAGAIGKPPVPVMIAMFLGLVVVLLDLRDVFVAYRQADPSFPNLKLAVGAEVLGVVFLAAVVFLLSRRLNWVRWVFVALAALRLLSFLQRLNDTLNLEPDIHVMLDMRVFILACAPPVLLVAAATLLLWPARAWYTGPR